MRPKPIYDPQKIRKTLVAIDITKLAVAGADSEKLPSVPQLRDCVAVIKVEAFNTTLVTKSPDGKLNAPDALYKCTFLTIGDADQREKMQKVPLAEITRSNGVKVEDINLTLDGGKNPLDPENTKITIGDLSTKGAGEVVLLLFTYVVK